MMRVVVILFTLLAMFMTLTDGLELVHNGGFESSTDGWWCLGCQMTLTSDKYSGHSALKVTNRLMGMRDGWMGGLVSDEMDAELQGLVYDILRPTTAVVDYDIRLENCQFFVGAQMAVHAHTQTHTAESK